MSYVNKGSMPVTVMVSRYPDQSGNFVCNGTADNVEIQAALDHGGVFCHLYIKNGTYNLIQAITLPSGFSGVFEGESRWGVMLNMTVNNQNVIVHDSVTRSQQMILKNFAIDGTDAGTGNGLYLKNVRLARIESLDIRDMGNYGIYCENVMNSNFHNCNIRSNGHGVYLGRDGVLLRSNNNTIQGGQISDNTGNGVFIDESSANEVDADIESNGTGIRLDGVECAFNVIYGWIEGNAVGILIVDSDPYDNVVHPRRMSDTITDNGTRTRYYEPLLVPFVEGSTLLSNIANPVGWEIDLAGEYAIGFAAMPPWARGVYSVTVYGVGLVGPGAGNGMTLEIQMRGGMSDQPWTQETVVCPNIVTNELNFTANDIVTWTITSADDPDVDDFVGGDAFAIQVLHEAASGGDITTDACIWCAQVLFLPDAMV